MSATGNVNKTNVVNSYLGAMYFPMTWWINGSGGATALCAMFVARRITFTGNSGISLKNMSDASCAASGMPSNSAVRMIRLVA